MRELSPENHHDADKAVRGHFKGSSMHSSKRLKIGTSTLDYKFKKGHIKKPLIRKEKLTEFREEMEEMTKLSQKKIQCAQER